VEWLALLAGVPAQVHWEASEALSCRAIAKPSAAGVAGAGSSAEAAAVVVIIIKPLAVAVVVVRALLPLEPRMSVPGRHIRDLLMVLRRLRRQRSVR
jgi:L-cystine uptake protein TcyP (sodium:dicarboxylate symporter family)